MDKPELNASNYQANIRQLYENASKAIAQLALLIAIGSLSSHSFAASQGEWGRSSTATAKITLRILPRDHGSSVAEVNYLDTKQQDAAQGHTAFQAYCGASSSFNRPSGLFTASVVQPRQELNADLDSLLRTSCPESSAAIRPSAPRVSADGDQLTVLISPV